MFRMSTTVNHIGWIDAVCLSIEKMLWGLPSQHFPSQWLYNLLVSASDLSSETLGIFGEWSEAETKKLNNHSDGRKWCRRRPLLEFWDLQTGETSATTTNAGLTITVRPRQNWSISKEWIVKLLEKGSIQTTPNRKHILDHENMY